VRPGDIKRVDPSSRRLATLDTHLDPASLLEEVRQIQPGGEPVDDLPVTEGFGQLDGDGLLPSQRFLRT
jgi:hypothetical protein